MITHKPRWQAVFLQCFWLCLCNSVLYTAWILPWVHQKHILQVEYAALVDQYQNLQRLMAQKQRIFVKNKRMVAQHQSLLQHLPQAKQTTTILTKISTLASAQQLTLISMIPMSEVVSTEYRIRPMQIVFLGEYAHVIAFLTKITQVCPYIYWQTLDMQRLWQENSTQEVLKVRVLVDVYSR